MNNESNTCNFLYGSAMEYSSPSKFLKMKMHLCKILKSYSPQGSPKIPAKNADIRDLNLEVNEWVQVRPEEEILATLDERSRLRGLYFMPEMKKFCGKKFRVYKKVKKIRLESTGEIRKIISPTVFLVGVFCDGEFSGGCDRSCYLFWREAWLNRTTPPENLLSNQI